MLHPGQSALEKGRVGVVFVDYTPRCIKQQRSNSACSKNFFFLSQKKLKAKKEKYLVCKEYAVYNLC